LRKNKGKTHIGSRILVIVLLLSMILPLFPTMKAEAADVEYIDYRALLEKYKKMYNVDFDTPTPKFDLKIQNGKTHHIAPTPAEDENPYHYRSQMKAIDTIKPGTKFQVFDKSSPASGNKLIRWEWQVYYRDKDGNLYYDYIIIGTDNSLTNLPAPTKEGTVQVFLNVADNYEIKRNPKHINASHHGNWRTEVIMPENITDNPKLQVKGWYFTGVLINVEDPKSDMIMRELELIDPETGEVIESFKREVDSKDPFNPKKEKLIRTSKKPEEAAFLSKDKTYKVRAKYQFVSFEKGNFDISKPETMTVEQKNLSTGVIPNELNVHYSYDDNVFKDGVFDESRKEMSLDGELKNLEEASFEWEYKVPKTAKKYVKIAGIIPNTFAKKEKDDNPNNNWAVVFGRTGLRSKE